MRLLHYDPLSSIIIYIVAVLSYMECFGEINLRINLLPCHFRINYTTHITVRRIINLNVFLQISTMFVEFKKLIS